MISKELLSEVLGRIVKDIYEESAYGGDLTIYGDESVCLGVYNIYELAHECKEWAYKEKYELRSYKSRIWKDFRCECLDTDGNIIPFKADTEPEAIFKACEWIMEQGKQDGKM